MRKKLKALLRKFPKLTRGQKLVRNLILCFLLLGLVCWINEWELPLPITWQFRLAEQKNLVAPSDIVATLDFEDAIDNIQPSLNNIDADLAACSKTYEGERLILGVRENWLYMYSNPDHLFDVIERDPDITIYMTYFGRYNGKRAFQTVVVHTDLPATTVEADLKFNEVKDHLVGQSTLENGACLLILTQDGEPTYNGEIRESEGQLHLTLRDADGQVIYERTGKINDYGGWIQ